MRSVAILGALSIWLSACSSRGEAPSNATIPEGPDGGRRAPPDGGAPQRAEATDIVFEGDSVFAQRSCTVAVRYQGNAREVKVAGEFTNWAASARPMTRTTAGFELVLSPEQGLEAGKLYGYKLVVDGVWIIDPNAPYRKIVGDTMNSALRLPTCETGPEVLPGKLTTSLTGNRGTARVDVVIRKSARGDAPTRMMASLDGQKLAENAWAAFKSEGRVSFTLADLAMGKHRLSLRATDANGTEAEPIDLPFWIEAEPFDYRDGILYMFMLDRFANGNPANDQSLGAPVHRDADWHGGDLEGALAVLSSGYFEKLGVRTIWLSPLNEQTSKHHTGDGNQLYSAYHGYWPTKARSVEPRFGGGSALSAFVAEAHKRGIRVLLDLINNQVHEDHEYVATHPDWFRKACKCGDDANGCGWSQRPFDCLFQFYLPDINWRNERAERQFIDDAVYWITTYDFDGFRVDAVKHVEANSVYNMRAELARRFEQAGARIFMVGETAVGENDSGEFFGERFSDGFAWIDAYTGPNALDGQFDFPTRHNMADGLVSGTKPLDQVEGELRKAESRYRPESRHVRFLNGHDNPRIATIAARDTRLGCSWASGCRDAQLPPATYADDEVFRRLKRALTVLYSLPGIPYLYAGDEIAMGGGFDPDMRRDMIFGEESLRPLQMTRSNTPPLVLTQQQLDLRDWVRRLGAARSESIALRRGSRITLVGNDPDLWVYAYAAGPARVAIVVVNRGGDVSRVVNASALDLSGITGFRSATGTGTLAVAGNALQLTIGAGEAALFVPQ